MVKSSANLQTKRRKLRITNGILCVLKFFQSFIEYEPFIKAENLLLQYFVWKYFIYGTSAM